MPEARDAMWYVLEKIQKDIDRIDEKQDSQLVRSTQVNSTLEQLANKVSELNRMLTYDNGKPSIVSQLRTSTGELQEIKSLVNKLNVELVEVKNTLGIKTPKEVSVERWKTAGKVAIAISAILPGILSFVHDFM